MNVLHLPSNVGRNPWHLSRGERALGLKSDVLSIDQDWLGYPADIQLNTEGMHWPKKLYTLSSAFLKCRSNYDVFHFNFGRSLLHFPARGLPHLDLSFYPKSARLFVTYQGCDIRQKFPTQKRTQIAACHQADCYGGQCNSGRLDELRRLGLKKMSPHVEHIWAVNPDLLYFLPTTKSSFIPYAVTPPIDPPSFAGSGEHLALQSGRLRILHAPTNRAAKGSFFILKALNELKQKYPDQVETLLVERMSHDQALKAYQSADLVIDQILIGWYGALAVECLFMGIPVICRIAKEDLHFIPEQMAKDVQKTFISAEPDSIYDVLEYFIQHPDQLQPYRQLSLNFAMRWHHPKRVAEITRAHYAGFGATSKEQIQSYLMNDDLTQF